VTEFASGWPVKRLTEVFQTQLGKMLSVKARAGFNPKPYLRNANVQWGRADLSSIYFMDFTENEQRKYALKPGDLLMCEGGEIGRTCIWRGELPECYFQKAIHRLRPRSRDVEPEFYLYWMEWAFRIANIYGVTGTQTTIAHLPQEKLEELDVPVPSISEQRAIAQAFQSVQEAKEARQRELALEHERKAALMEHLFTHGTRGGATKNTAVGEIPKSWHLTTLGELCKDGLGTIQTGPFGSQLHASDYIEEGVPVVNPTHLGFNCIETSRVPKISKELADSLSKHYLLTGDILISRRGDFSRYAFVGADEAGWLCGTGCMLIRLANSVIDNYFLALSMSLGSTQDYLEQSAVGSIMPNLNTTILSQMPVLVPAIEEQHQIAEVLRASETKVRALETELPLVEEVFDALLAELMNGHLSIEPIFARQEAQ